MTHDANPSEAGRLTAQTPPSGPGPLRLAATGAWTLPHAGALQQEVARLRAGGAPAGGRVEIEASGVTALDTAGAWLLLRAAGELEGSGAEIEIHGLTPERQSLFDIVAEHGGPLPEVPRGPGGLVAVVEQVGRAAVEAGGEAVRFVAFLGRVTQTLARTLRHPRRLRVTPWVFHMETAGLDALPIVGLISFLIGVVLAYQGAVQLRELGADIFVVDLVGVAVLREFGILLAAILVAGRSGSAFTAAIGAMVIDEEVDALHTLGLDPVEVLVLPRVLALVVTLPLLTFFADLLGILGGGLMAWASLDLTPHTFLDRLQEVVTLESFLVGLVKAPVFALVIGLVGCTQGLAVRASSESLGRNTTRSVVQSIFLVIVLDAFFSIFFNVLGV
jgi:phospholipid/cholesterol/gamma-HCH transport system permease protein